MSSCVICAKPLRAADVRMSWRKVLLHSKITIGQLLVEVGIFAQGHAPGHVCIWCTSLILEIDGAWVSRMLSLEAVANRSSTGSEVQTAEEQGLKSNGVPTGGENSVAERGCGQMDTSDHGPDLGSAPGASSSYSEEHHSYGNSAPSGQKNPVQNGEDAGSSSDSRDSDSSSGSSGSRSSSGSSGSSSSSDSADPAVITTAIFSKPCCMCDHVFSADDQPIKGGTPLAWKSESFFEYAQEKGLLPPAPRSKNFCSDCHDAVAEVDYWSFMFDKAVAKLKRRRSTSDQVKAGILVHDANGEVTPVREWMRKDLQPQQAGTDSSATPGEEKGLNKDLPAPPAKNDETSGEKKAKTPKGNTLSGSALQSDGLSRSSGESVANPGAVAARRGEKRRLGTNNHNSFNGEQAAADTARSFHRLSIECGTPPDCESDEPGQQNRVTRGRQGEQANVKKARRNSDPGMNN